MKQVIRTTNSHVDISYLNGNYITLSAKNFQYEMSENSYIFEFDISSNLNLRNKSTNQYSDAKSFLEDAKLLKNIRISDDQIYKNLRTSFNSNKPQKTYLKVVNANQIVGIYPIKFQVEGTNTLFIEII